MRIVERLGRRLTGESDEEPRPYVCTSCDARFERQYHVCPACEGYSVERARWQEEEPIP